MSPFSVRNSRMVRSISAEPSSEENDDVRARRLAGIPQRDAAPYLAERESESL